MAQKPRMTKENIVPLYETKFLSLYDLQYAEGRHYFNASRNSLEAQACLLSDEEAKSKRADAVNIVFILREKGEEPKLLLSYEYRYPTGQFLLSPPAGMIDPADGVTEEALFTASVREIKEETGITVKATDRLFIVNPLVWSTPGMTDESNALMCAVVDVNDLSELNQKGAEGTELFDGFELLNRAQALKVFRNGRDKNGIYYSVYTWCALSYFLSGAWEE